MRIKTLHKIITGLFFILSFSTHGAVDIKSAALIEQFTDWTAQDQSFQLIRQYSSRRLKMGLFGFGWCSNIEDSLTANPNGSLTLRTCLDGKEEIFFKEIVGFKSPGTGSKIQFVNQQYQLLRTSALTQGESEVHLFNSEGQWVGLVKKGIKVILQKEKANWWLQANDDKLKLNMKSAIQQPLVESLQFRQQKWLYTYRQLNLVEVKKSELDVVSYEYDQFKNLTSIKGPDFWRTFSYDTEKDQILAVMDGECIERYSYLNPSHSQKRFQVDLRYSCLGRAPIQLRYQFLESTELGLRLKAMTAVGKGLDIKIKYDKNEMIESRESKMEEKI